MTSAQSTPRRRNPSGQKKKPHRKAFRTQDNSPGSKTNGSVLHPEVPEGHLLEDFSLLPSSAAIIVTLLVTLLTLALRVYYVTLETSWWILHPDEIYQSLEGMYT